MPHTDPIGDMITRIRNASTAKHKNVSIPASKVKMKILEIMAKEGFILSFRTMKDQGRSFFDVELRYRSSGEPCIGHIKRISKPGIRYYSASDEIPKIKSGMGLTIVSTSKGMMTDRDAKKENVGGELILSIC